MPKNAQEPPKTGKPSNGRGGKRPGAGRPRGRANIASKEELRDLEKLAKPHAALALRTLVKICRHGKSESARATAANSLLDRGWGKPRQAVEHSGEGGGPLLVTVTHKVIDAEPA